MCRIQDTCCHRSQAICGVWTATLEYNDTNNKGNKSEDWCIRRVRNWNSWARNLCARTLCGRVIRQTHFLIAKSQRFFSSLSIWQSVAIDFAYPWSLELCIAVGLCRDTVSLYNLVCFTTHTVPYTLLPICLASSITSIRKVYNGKKRLLFLVSAEDSVFWPDFSYLFAVIVYMWCFGWKSNFYQKCSKFSNLA